MNRYQLLNPTPRRQPAINKSSSMANQHEQDSKQQQNFHVLLVDDNHVERKILEKKLLTRSSSDHIHVTCVDSPDKALNYLGLLDDNDCDSSISSSPHHQEMIKVNLIMTDYSMPGMTGYDLLQRVKKSHWKDVPVVVMSSENVTSRINMCLEGGAEEFLLKPVQLSDVKRLTKTMSSVNADGLKQTMSSDTADELIV